jgi:uncharacterized protein YpmB
MGKRTVSILVITAIIIIIAVAAYIHTYNVARDQYLDGHEQSKELAIEEGKLSSIDTIETYNGQVKYHVLSGINGNDEKVYVWIPQTKKMDKVIIKKQSSGITADQAKTEVLKEHNPKEIIDVKLGMDEEIPIWEVKYRDQSDRYTFDYVNFSDGEIIKHMAIKNERKY